MRNNPIRNSTQILAAALLAILAAGCSQDNSGTRGYRGGAGSSVIPAVEAVQARYGSLPLKERISGTVIAKNQVALYPEISGRIAEVLVNNGDPVERGEPLIRIEDQQFQEQVQQAKAGFRINNARLKQANARLRELEAQYKRTKTLAEKNLSSELELETLEARMESARADVELAQAQLEQSESNLQEQQEILSKTIVRAPVSGSVGQRNAEIGMQVGPNSRLFTIGNLGSLRVEVILTESMLNNVAVGQSAEILASGENSRPQVLRAELSRISPFLNPVARSTEAEIDISNSEGLLRPGMFVPVDILYGESRQATLLPTSALYTNPNTGDEGVFVATALGSEIEPVNSTDSGSPAPLTEATEVQFRPVEIIARGRMEIAVTDVEPGDWVVTIGQQLLSVGRNQARVRTSSWDRILTMQGLQRQDLLNNVLDEQKKRKDSIASQPTM
ncbi:MAG: efflux RND transporter periplasmic adaptor subunit [Balneolaceae bacterium]|nr:efflux RND transporter periplasmic adaptor subunit [Balneolaceae bacterium]